jgi:phospholipid/cholesterol/gamma-HCH transport system substrate-binding protein
VINRRVWVNLGVFTVLFALMATWGVRNFLHLGFLEHPYRVTAEFSSSPGLRSGFEVTYLGVHVGDVGTVRLVGDRVTAVLQLQHGVALPADVTAGVSRKSAVGEPYVNLTPLGGVDGRGPRLKGGALIPLARTTTPPDYSRLFDATANLLNAVPADDLGRLVHALAAGFNGRAEDLRSIFASVDQLTATLAANAPLLNQLAGDVTQLTHTITQHRGDIGQSWDNLAVLSATLDQKKGAITALLDHAPTLTDQVNSLLNSAGPGIGCTFDSAAALFSSLTPPQLQSLADLIRLSPLAADVIKQAQYIGPDGPYLTGSFRFNPANLLSPYPVVTYRPPHQLPAPPAAAGCGQTPIAGTAGVGVTGDPAASGGQLGGTHAPGVSARPARPATALDPSSRATHHQATLFDRLRVLTAVVALLGAAVLLIATRPWRLVLARRRHH